VAVEDRQYAGITFTGPYIGSATLQVNNTVSPHKIVNISGTINGSEITGLSNFNGANNEFYVFGERPFAGVIEEHYYLHDDGLSFEAGGVSYNIRNPSNSFGGEFLSGTNFITSSVNSTPASVQVSAGRDIPVVICFVTGTKIRTKRGEVAVEDLRAGDLAVAASGRSRQVVWIGHRQIERPTFEQSPVRVRASAFGHGLPVNDLYLSPGHPVLVGADADNEGGVLVPVMCLINGTTITREPVASVTYWHVELDAHDILLAEGLPAESYIDGGDRAFFSEFSDHALHNPDFVVPGWDGRCRPVAVDGPLVEAERLRLDGVFAGSLSAQCDWELSSPAISQW
jgi:hypothetical protein